MEKFLKTLKAWGIIFILVGTLVHFVNLSHFERQVLANWLSWRAERMEKAETTEQIRGKNISKFEEEAKQNKNLEEETKTFVEAKASLLKIDQKLNLLKIKADRKTSRKAADNLDFINRSESLEK